MFIYPNTLINYRKTDLEYSKNPIYYLYNPNKTETVEFGTGSVEYPSLYINLITGTNTIDTGYVASDISFNINGVTFKSVDVVKNNNEFLKKTVDNVDGIDVLDSLFLAFKNTGILDEYDYTYDDRYIVNTGYYLPRYLDFTLTSKKIGNKFNFTTTNNPVSFTNAYERSVVITNIDSFIFSDAYGNDVSDDVANYQIGLDIYEKINYTSNGYTEKFITSVAKRTPGFTDFNISNIIRNAITNWTPTVTTFNSNVNKYVQEFVIRPFQKFQDLNVNLYGNYQNQYYDSTNIQTLMAIDGGDGLFDYPTTTLTIDQQPNSSLFLRNNTSVNNLFDKLLTKQPKVKVAQTFEMLSAFTYRTKIASTEILNDTWKIKIFFYDNIIDEIEINQNQNSLYSAGKPYSYISQMCLETNKIISFSNYRLTKTLSDIKKIEITFVPNFYGGGIAGIDAYDPIPTFETQTLDYQTVIENECNDETNNDIPTKIVFKNSKGGFDTFDFLETEEFKTNKTYLSYNTPYSWNNKAQSEFGKIFNSQFEKTYLAKTRILTQEEFLWLEDLVISDQVYIINDYILTPIIITNVEYGNKKDSNNIIAITYSYSRPENI